MHESAKSLLYAALLSSLIISAAFSATMTTGAHYNNVSTHDRFGTMLEDLQDDTPTASERH